MIAPEYAALIPAAILVLVGGLLPLLGAFNVRGIWLATIAAISYVAAFVLSAASLYAIPGLGFMPSLELGNPAIISFALLEWTPFVALFDLVFIAVALLVTIGSPGYIGNRHEGEYYGLIMLSTVGMMMVAASRDLITLFIGLELSSFASYALAGFFKRRIASSEAAMKYFIIGSVSSSLAIFGISIVYGLTGSTSFEALASLWGTAVRLEAGGTTTIAAQVIAGGYPIAVFVWGLLLAGFGFKVAIVPFHNYAVDVYDGAPSTVGGFLAAGSKQMGFAALFKVFLLGMFAVKANWELAIGVLAIITMVVGNVAALSQYNLKRLLAYSSIAHAGYILMALSIGTGYALAGGLMHIVTYSIMQVGAFLGIAAAARWGVGASFEDWKGMGKRSPLLALCMAIFLFSFAGIPPLAGFASKFVLFSSAIAAGGWFITLAVAGIVTSAISLVYYWKLVRVMYVEEGASRRITITSAAGIAILIAAGVTILFGILPGIVLEPAQNAALHVFTNIAR